MRTFKLTTWNIEHLGRILTGGSTAARRRLDAVAREIREIDPGILCIIEAPADLPALNAWVAAQDGLQGRYRIPTIPGTDDILAANPPDVRAALASLYAMKGNRISGNQWIWFLVREDIAEAAARVEMQAPAVWQQLTGGDSWLVNYWGDMSVSRHRHWRHPQVLVLELDGLRAEFVGIHLKSKINRKRARDANGELRREYVEVATKARIKLATEALNIRTYIEGRFDQEPEPAIFVLGDANDGPGRRFFERRFLFFDLISDLQGDVFFARRFLNHCLFDFEDHLRFTTEFRDPVDPDEKRQLLDHILFTQPVVARDGFPRVHAGAGLVEHRIHETINATLVGPDTSDHRPVSVEVTWSP